MTAPLYAIGRFCSRHHYPTIAVWLVVAVVLVVVGQASGDKTNDNLTLPGTGSTVATELLEDNLPEQAYGSNPLAIESKGGPLTEPKYAKAIEETGKRLQAMPEVNSAISPLSPAGAEFLSKDRTVAYFPVVLGVGPGELTEEQAEAVLDAAGPDAEDDRRVGDGLVLADQAFFGPFLAQRADRRVDHVHRLQPLDRFFDRLRVLGLGQRAGFRFEGQWVAAVGLLRQLLFHQFGRVRRPGAGQGEVVVRLVAGGLAGDYEDDRSD